MDAAAHGGGADVTEGEAGQRVWGLGRVVGRRRAGRRAGGRGLVAGGHAETRTVATRTGANASEPGNRSCIRSPPQRIERGRRLIAEAWSWRSALKDELDDTPFRWQEPPKMNIDWNQLSQTTRTPLSPSASACWRAGGVHCRPLSDRRGRSAGLEGPRAQHVEPTLLRYIGSMVSVSLNVLLVVAVLGSFGVETTSFAALVAAMGIAIGAAWAGLLANFAAGVFVVVLRPFKVGTSSPLLASPDSGADRSSPPRSSRPDNVHTVVGNGKVFGDTIQNFTSTVPSRRSHGATAPRGGHRGRDLPPEDAPGAGPARRAGTGAGRRTAGLQPDGPGAGRAAGYEQRLLLAGVFRHQQGDRRGVRGRLSGAGDPDGDGRANGDNHGSCAFLVLTSSCEPGTWHAHWRWQALASPAGYRVAVDRCRGPDDRRGADRRFCGRLEVFEDRQAGQGRTIALKIVCCPPCSNDPRPDPLFFLAGGLARERRGWPARARRVPAGAGHPRHRARRSARHGRVEPARMHFDGDSLAA